MLLGSLIELLPQQCTEPICSQAKKRTVEVIPKDSVLSLLNDGKINFEVIWKKVFQINL